MKSNHMLTKRLHIKLSKTAFFDILKYVRKHACLIVSYHVYTPSQPTYDFQISTTFIWQDKSSEKKLSGFMTYQ